MKEKLKELFAALKNLITKENALQILTHLKDYKITYSIVVAVASILGIVIEAETVAMKIVSVATLLSSLIA